MGITYQVNKSENTVCEKPHVNRIKLKEQGNKYNEKEKSQPLSEEKLADIERDLDFETEVNQEKTAELKKITTDEEDGNEKNSILKRLQERRLPDFSETVLDEDFFDELSKMDFSTIEIANFKKETAIIKNKQLKTIAETICKKEQLNRYLLQYIREIDAGLNNITDSKILKYLKSELKRLADIDYDTEHFDDPEIGECEYFASLSNIANIVDTYNTMTGKYTRYKAADLSSDSVFMDKSIPAAYIDKFKEYAPEKIENFIKALNIESNEKHPLVADFESSLRTESLESLSNNKEMLDYMYEKYYVNKITDKSAKKLCREINSTYGVRVLLSNKTFNIKRSLIIIKKELENWTTKSGGKAKLPKILDLNACDSSYEKASAYTNIRGNIHHNGARIYSPRAIRHEIMHLNEPSIFAKFSSDPELVKLIRSIIPSKKIKFFGREKEVLDWDNCKYREEFLKAGINPEHVEYAYTNRNEFLAVAAEGDLSQYSPEFREILLKIGMPEYVFDLPIDDDNVKTNVNNVKKILKEHPNSNFDELVEYIEDGKYQELSPQEKLLQAIFGKIPR